MEFFKVIHERFSCRAYSDKPVEQEKLEAVLEAGRAAPTARNSQPHHIYVIKTPENIAKIDELTQCRYGAPIVMMITYDENAVYTYPGDKYNSGAEDAAIVAAHLALAAADVGLNSCWLNRFDPDKAKEAFGLPDNETAVILLDIGYKAENAVPAPKHTDRKPLSETVTYM